MAQDKLTVKMEKFSFDIASGKYDYDWLAYEANYDCEKMSKNAIYVETCRLLKNPKVSLRIKELKENIIKGNQVTINDVLIQLSNWLNFDPLKLIDEDTEAIKSLKDMDKDSRMSLAEIHVQETFGWEESPDGKKVKTKTGELKKIKFIDKRATADMFMKKFGQYVLEKDSTNDNLELIRDIIENIKK